MAIENMAFPPTGFNMFQSHHDDQDRLPSTSLNNAIFPCPQFHDNGNSSSHNLPFFRRSMSFSRLDHEQEPVIPGHGGGGDDDLSDDGSQMLGEKKKRLSLEQVKALEKSFELGNKLEPERKVQLARALGLQPRQIAIWFQNRRARWKTKQLERDYEVLRKQCDALRTDNECLQSDNEKLHSELVALKRRYTNDGALPIPKSELDQGSNWSNNGSCENSPISNSGTKNGHLGPLSRPPMATHQFLHGHNVVQEDSFCNMFGNGGGMEDNQVFWSWTNTPTTDHHNQFH